MQGDGATIYRWKKVSMAGQASQIRHGAVGDACWDSKYCRKSPWQQARSDKVGYGGQSKQNRACSSLQTGLADLPRFPRTAVSSAPALAVPPRCSGGWRNSADSQPFSPSFVPARTSRGIPNSARTPRRLTITSRPLSLRGARAVLHRLRADREHTALGLPVSLSAARGVEFCGPREPRGDSASAWVWFGLRVRFRLVPTANFYC